MHVLVFELRIEVMNQPEQWRLDRLIVHFLGGPKMFPCDTTVRRHTPLKGTINFYSPLLYPLRYELFLLPALVVTAVLP